MLPDCLTDGADVVSDLEQEEMKILREVLRYVFSNELLVLLYMIRMYMNFSLENTTNQQDQQNDFLKAMYTQLEWPLFKCLGLNVSDFGILAQLTDKQP